ncbi:MAG: FAD-binding oxidoreductase [Pseudomonadota bacterium]|nr:FAD-binding oxidoreductase [Pseudomonadota bacterium]
MSGNGAHFDFIVIGAGIAGTSVAAELSATASVLLVEGESQPGYHATGRSAAMYVPAYGPPAIRALTRAAGPFFHAPPDGFTETPLLHRRDILMIARENQRHSTADFIADAGDGISLESVEGDRLAALQPLLRRGYATHGVIDSSGSEIDVNALHRGFLRLVKARGGQLVTNRNVTALHRDGGVWHVAAGDAVFRAPVVINAAGAWADEIGRMAGAEVIGLVPKRRTALMIAAPPGIDSGSLPMTIDMDEAFYLKPESGQFLVSPANEDPMPPCDVQPEEMDIAICLDRIGRAFDIPVTRPQSKWAGLRSFVADKVPVAGFSDIATGFFWLAGQGGYGIQTSPALARVAASLVQGRALPPDIAAQGVSTDMLAPARLTPAEATG